MGSATARGGRASYAWSAGRRVGVEGWRRRRGGLVVGALALLILGWQTLRDEPCKWCLRSAPFLVGGVLFAFRGQVAEVLRLLLA
ncbi:hypothetical protein UFOVP469_53 [uncultured Caudovirales phage]|uniref:Uncharacterized protein n=1 Tax=uncultured Caudovirales phage TaxID=2100421 RepID=A0A6J5MDW6_9CAUD|nr:hypothetical protein UFOVP469_53 [uncultured Caudovirales phage]CAB4189964.1 hypothetical protein UFOVP1200_26 [uncultured Caudovirales phage]